MSLHLRCHHWEGAARCTASAEVSLHAPNGTMVPAGWLCRAHAHVIVSEYAEKLREQWTTRELYIPAITDRDRVFYFVLDEHTLGYVDVARPTDFCILAGDVHGHSWKSGSVPVPIFDTEPHREPATKADFARFRVDTRRLRAATKADFETFRVQMPPDFTRIDASAGGSSDASR